jgi:hypothetical protein
MRGAPCSVSASTTIGSLRNGSMMLGLSVGRAMPASESKRVRGDSLMVPPSPLPPAPRRVVSRARPPVLSR